LGGFVRPLVLPFVKNNAKNVLMNAVKKGMEVADGRRSGREIVEGV